MGSVIARLRGLLTFVCVLAIIAIPLWFAAAGFGARFGLWDWRFGLEVMVGEIGPLALVGATCLAALTLVVNAVSQFMKDVPRSAGGFLAGSVLLLIGGVGGYQLHTFNTHTGRLPAIHDITTDPDNPPQFTASLIVRRGAEANSVEYDGKADPVTGRPLAEVQAEAYPDIQPIVLETDPDTAYRTALRIAREKGWTVSTASASQLSFEATATTFWFGFRDDVVVRITPLADGGAVVDARSVSRELDADRGANAARLRRFEARLRAATGEA
ncbi:DUF1499 domain-containing protein [Glycocaulis sp.]